MKKARPLPYFMTVLLALFVAACQEAPSQEAPELSVSGGQGIFGGTEITSKTGFFFRNVVSIENEIDGNNDCTGSLIGERVVLTAAHCVSDTAEFKETTKVRLFALHAGDGEEGKPNGYLRRIQKLVIAPEYSRRLAANPLDRTALQYDIALILLTETPALGYERVAVAERDLGPSVWNYFWSVGYGADGGEIDFDENDRRLITPTGAGPLRKVHLRRSIQPESPHWIQAQQDHRGICYGDSGAPAYATVNGLWVQIGVSTFVKSTDQGVCRKEGYFVNLGSSPPGMEQSWKEWIDAQVAELEAEPPSEDPQSPP